MNKIKTFFYMFANSLIPSPYYNDVIRAKTATSIKYFIAYLGILTIISTAALTVDANRDLTPFIEKLKTEISSNARAYYPEDLVITIKDGNLETNSPEPVYLVDIDTPNELNLSHIALIHPDGTIDDYDNANVLFLVNRKNIIYRNNQKLEVLSIKDMTEGTQEPITIDYNTYLKLVDEGIMPILGKAHYLPLIILPILLMLGSGLYLYGFYFTYALIAAGIIALIAASMNKKLGYEGGLRIAIHASTAPLLLHIIELVSERNIPIPFWFSLMIFIYALIALSNYKKTEQVA